MAEGKKTTELRRRKGKKKKKIFILIHIPDTTTKTTKKKIHDVLLWAARVGQVGCFVIQPAYVSIWLLFSLSLSLRLYTPKQHTHTAHTWRQMTTALRGWSPPFSNPSSVAPTAARAKFRPRDQSIPSARTRRVAPASGIHTHTHTHTHTHIDVYTTAKKS
jgi:hypothetical protein